MHTRKQISLCCNGWLLAHSLLLCATGDARATTAPETQASTRLIRQHKPEGDAGGDGSSEGDGVPLYDSMRSALANLKANVEQHLSESKARDMLLQLDPSLRHVLADTVRRLTPSGFKRLSWRARYIEVLEQIAKSEFDSLDEKQVKAAKEESDKYRTWDDMSWVQRLAYVRHKQAMTRLEGTPKSMKAATMDAMILTGDVWKNFSLSQRSQEVERCHRRGGGHSTSLVVSSDGKLDRQAEEDVPIEFPFLRGEETQKAGDTQEMRHFWQRLKAAPAPRQYKINSFLGQGADAAVFSATLVHRGPGDQPHKKVALKAFPAGTNAGLSEWYAAHRLRNASIPGAVLVEDKPYLAALWDLPRVIKDHVLPIAAVDYYMLLVEPFERAGTLEHALARRELSTKEIFICLRDIASTLAPMHKKNIYHGDVKPDNVLLELDKHGKISSVKLSDLSSAAVGYDRHVLADDLSHFALLLYMLPQHNQTWKEKDAKDALLQPDLAEDGTWTWSETASQKELQQSPEENAFLDQAKSPEEMKELTDMVKDPQLHHLHKAIQDKPLFRSFPKILEGLIHNRLDMEEVAAIMNRDFTASLAH